MKLDEKEKMYECIINKHYNKLLDRKPDKVGFQHYFWLLNNNIIDEEMMIKDIKNSAEYKMRSNFRNELRKLLDDKS